MAFSSAVRSGPLADINVTPLVDVMLVLLIIFIVTAPIVARPIAVQLPQATDRVVDRPEPPPPIELRLDAGNQLSWNGQPMAISELQARLQAQVGEHAGEPAGAAHRHRPGGRVRRHGADIGCGRGDRHGADCLRAIARCLTAAHAVIAA